MCTIQITLSLPESPSFNLRPTHLLPDILFFLFYFHYIKFRILHSDRCCYGYHPEAPPVVISRLMSKLWFIEVCRMPWILDDKRAGVHTHFPFLAFPFSSRFLSWGFSSYIIGVKESGEEWLVFFSLILFFFSFTCHHYHLIGSHSSHS
jgi:hypothetical protein